MALTCCNTAKHNEAQHKIGELFAYIRKHTIDTTGGYIDSMLYKQTFFSDSLRKKKYKYGLYQIILMGVKQKLNRSDSFYIESVDLKEYRDPTWADDRGYKVIFLKGNSRNDSVYIRVEPQGIRSLIAFHKGEYIVSWW